VSVSGSRGYLERADSDDRLAQASDHNLLAVLGSVQERRKLALGFNGTNGLHPRISSLVKAVVWLGMFNRQ